MRPFRALHFDPRRVPIGDAIAPPFDVVSDAERSALAARSPYNMVHLILPRRGDEPHVHELLCAWRRDGVLVLDAEPAYYWLEERYVAPDGVRRTRRGFIGLVGIEPYERAVVLPHERIREAPVLGRLELLRATRAHLSPIFGVYHDPAGRAEDALVTHRDPEPMLEATAGDGTAYALWRVRTGHEAVAEVLAASTVLVADGHHRYETALAVLARARRRRPARGLPARAPGERRRPPRDLPDAPDRGGRPRRRRGGPGGGAALAGPRGARGGRPGGGARRRSTAARRSR